MTQSSEHSTIWLTQEAFDKLQDELEHLRGPVRQEIIGRISAAREEGDLRENGGYHAAREEQGKTEARIRQLEDMLRRAEVGETPADDGIVEPGIETPADLQVYSPQSPMGSAINGKRVGDKVEFDAPNGKKLAVEIVDAVPYTG